MINNKPNNQAIKSIQHNNKPYYKRLLQEHNNPIINAICHSNLVNIEINPKIPKNEKSHYPIVLCLQDDFSTLPKRVYDCFSNVAGYYLKKIRRGDIIR